MCQCPLPGRRSSTGVCGVRPKFDDGSEGSGGSDRATSESGFVGEVGEPVEASFAAVDVGEHAQVHLGAAEPLPWPEDADDDADRSRLPARWTSCSRFTAIRSSARTPS